MTFKGVPIQTSIDFLAENLQDKTEWNDIFKVLRGGGDCQPIILYPTKMTFRNEEEIKSFPNKQKLRQLITTRPAVLIIKRVY